VAHLLDGGAGHETAGAILAAFLANVSIAATKFVVASSPQQSALVVE
jgi:hypothetical protein